MTEAKLVSVLVSITESANNSHNSQLKCKSFSYCKICVLSVSNLICVSFSPPNCVGADSGQASKQASKQQKAEIEKSKS